MLQQMPDTRRFYMVEYKVFHVTRNLAKHAFELDDAIHGSPLPKENTDWALQQPDLYLQRLRTELARLEMALSDLQFVLRSKFKMEFNEIPFNMTVEDCDAYCYHKFHQRSFTYAEKISYWLQNKSPEEMKIDLPKARRQVKVLEAAIFDTNVSIVRFQQYSIKKNTM